MLLNSPIPRAPQPRFSQGSSLRSVRDSERPDRLWSKDKQTSEAVGAIHRELFKLRSELGRLRRRVLGGGSTAASGGIDYQGEWNPTIAYKAKVIVLFTPEGSPAAGNYISDQPVPAGVSPDTGYPYWSAFATGAPGMFL